MNARRRGGQPHERVVSTGKSVMPQSTDNLSQTLKKAESSFHFKTPAWTAAWFALVLVVCGIIIAAVHDDYGIAWDSALLVNYGEAVLEYYDSGGASKAYMECDDAHYYGGVVELAAAAVYTHFPHYKFEIHHLVCALFGLLAVAGVMAYACLFKERLALFFAPVILIMLPRFTGHAFINSKDIPFACGFAWTMFSIGLLFHGKKFTWPKFLLFGLCLGMALSVRTGGVLAFCFFGVQAGYYILVNSPWRGQSLRAAAFASLGLGLKTVAAVVVAWAVMIAFWPWALENPIVNPVKAFDLVRHFHRGFLVLFQGQAVWSNELPWYYLPWYLLITTPPAAACLALAGTLAGLWRVARAPRSQEAPAYVGLIFWFWFPVGYVLVSHPNIYDGIRHFLFILPALALLSAAGAAGVVGLLKGNPRKYAVAGLAVVLLTPAIDMIPLHPYQMTYFNLLTGKTAGAYGNYDTDYWLTSYKECVEWIGEQAGRTEGEVRVLAALQPLAHSCATYYAPSNCKFTYINPSRGGLETPHMPDAYDYYLATSRFFWHTYCPGDPAVFAAQRQGAVFTVVRARH